MNDLALVALVLAVIVIAYLSRRRTPRPDKLHRLYPGVAHKAEWMASEEIVRRVEADFLGAQQWLVEALLGNYTAYLHMLPRHFTGDALREQQRIVSLQMRKHGPRLVGILRAHHRIQVRRFSDNGLTCYVIDHQTERLMATYEYWSKRRLHTQDLGAGVYVYQVTLENGRWKIEALIQQLPLGWETFPVSSAPLELTDDLPLAAGRDV